MTLEEIGERLGTSTVWRASFQELKSDTHGIGSISFAGFTPKCASQSYICFATGTCKMGPEIL